MVLETGLRSAQIKTMAMDQMLVTCASTNTPPVPGLSLVVTSMGKPQVTILAIRSP